MEIWQLFRYSLGFIVNKYIILAAICKGISAIHSLKNYYNCWEREQIKENEDAGIRRGAYWEVLKK